MARPDVRPHRPAIEIADILRRHGEAYRRLHAGHLGRVERRVMSAIVACRTEALGGHVEACNECGQAGCWMPADLECDAARRASEMGSPAAGAR